MSAEGRSPVIFRLILLAFAGAFLLPSCKKSAQTAGDPNDSFKKDIIRNYSRIVYASYSDALSAGKDLDSALHQLSQTPSEQTLEKAQNAWRNARIPYSQTEAYRFYDGPIDNGQTGVEELLNAWPLDEVYVDYVKDQPNAGIINNPERYPSIDAELLKGLNENGGENNISTGFHAIEFLLWGQDLNDEGPGKRPFTDFTSAAKNSSRRTQYLLTCGDLLVRNLETLVLAWDEKNADSYASSLNAMDPDIALQKIITGLAMMSKGEMAGERMYTAYDNQSQEDEQSCFSDNTKNDLVNNQKGIFNVYDGRYVSMNGEEIHSASLSDLMNKVDPALNSELLQVMSDAEEQLNNIYDPFDLAIVVNEKRPAVLQAVKTLQKEGDMLSEVAKELGFSVNTNKDPDAHE